MPPRSALRRPGSRPTAPLDADARPLLSSRVAFERAADGSTWVATIDGVPSSRLSSAVVDLLTAMNGQTSLRDLHLRFAASEPSDGFLALIQRFRASGLLAGEARRPPGRLVYRPPLTLQVATLRAPALFDRLNRLTLPLPRRAVLPMIAGLLALGVLAASVQWPVLRAVLASPMPLPALVSVVAALAFLTLVHEGAHGIALARFGGSPRRAGFMLFYLTPAFFVDVTDGWRLSDRRQRVAVALAGPAVHAVVAALGLLAALVVPDPVVRDTLVFLSAACAAIVVVNLIPFVRFDGYLALMSALDRPNLRARTIRDAAQFLARVLFGARPSSKTVDTWWSVPFGLASILTPVLLVVFAVARIARALAGGGPILGLVVIAVEAAVAVVGIVLVARALTRILRSGVSRLRFVAVLAAIATGAVAVGAAVPVPLTATFGFVSGGDRVALVQAGHGTEIHVPEDARVLLVTNGILMNDSVGDGTVRLQRPESTEVPLDALFPVTAADVTLPAVIVAEVRLSEQHDEVPPVGQARVELGTRNLWETLWMAAVESPLSTLRGEK